LTVTDRSGIASIQTLKSTNYCAPVTEAMNNAPDPNQFWDTEHDRQRLLPEGVVRVAQVEMDSDFEWDGVTYDDDENDRDFEG
jgi:hypothetical protein